LADECRVNPRRLTEMILVVPAGNDARMVGTNHVEPFKIGSIPCQHRAAQRMGADQNQWIGRRSPTIFLRGQDIVA